MAKTATTTKSARPPFNDRLRYQRERNKKMIVDNFGSVENYQKIAGPAKPDLLSRGVLKVGRTIKKGAKKAKGTVDKIIKRYSK